MEQDVQPHSKAENPQVSVIVRTKDRPRLLMKALQSINRQTYRSIEVVLVNDGGCELDIEDLKTVLGDISLNYQRLEENTGRAHAGNVGIKNARGRYIGFLDDDDEFYPSHIKTLAACLNTLDYKIVYSDAKMIHKEYDAKSLACVDASEELSFSRDFDYDFLVFENYIPFMCLLFSKEVLIEAGGIDESFDLYEDWDLLIRLGEKYPFFHIRKVTARYNQWSSDMQISQMNRDHSFLRASYLRIISKHSVKITETRIHKYVSGVASARLELKDLRIALNSKDTRISYLGMVIRDKDARLDNREAVIRDKDTHIGNLEAVIDNREAVIRDKDIHIGNLEEVVRDKDNHISNLEAVIRDKDTHLEAVIRNKDTHIGNLGAVIDNREAVIRDKDIHIGNLEEVVRDKDNHISNLEAVIRDKDVHIGNLEASVRGNEAHRAHLERVLHDIYESEGWKALRIYYGVRDRIFPAGSGRRQAVKSLLFKFRKRNSSPARLLTKNSIKRSFSYIRMYGISAFVKKVKGKLESRPGSFHMPNVPDLKMPEVGKDEVVTHEDAAISVVIPTKNAGDDFELLMSIISRQEGLRQIEVIIVDSGSTDTTLKIAKTYGAKIMEIPPEKFSHSYSRNLGAEAAAHKYLFFTVQDALLPSTTFLSELLGVLRNNNVAAVSCAEFPREDTDLFYSVLIWNHYRFLEVDRQDRILALPEAVTNVHLRKNGQLSDIACLTYKDIFSRYEYRNDYAEDLDLGIRLIKDGHKLAFLGSVKIIHSHNRSAYYYIKRGYVDQLYLARIFPDYPLPKIAEKRLIEDIMSYPKLLFLVNEGLRCLKTPTSVEELFGVVNRELSSFDGVGNHLPSASIVCPHADKDFLALLARIAAHGTSTDSRRSEDGILFPAVLNYLNVVKEYMESVYQAVDEEVLDDFRSLIVKVYALNCGVHLAYCHLNGGGFINELHDELKGGI